MNIRRILVGLMASAVLVGLASCGGGGEGDEATGGASAPPTGLQPTLASIQENVFTVACATSGCHAGVSANFGLRLDPGFSYATLFNVPSPRDASLIRVVPFNPDASFLIQKLNGSQTLGERMPDGGPYLSTEAVAVIRQWIANGALP
ncbi:MAG: hypothetical protein ACKVP2_12370 [Burkholderiales bacterium]